MGVEAGYLPQIETGVQAPKPEVASKKTEGASVVHDAALKKWDASSLAQANEKSKIFAAGVIDDVRQELAKVTNAPEKTLTGSGFDRQKVQGEQKLVGSGYDKDAVSADSPSDKTAEGSIERSNTTGNPAIKDRPQRISTMDESGDAILVDTGQKVSELSDADVMIKINGHLGFREAMMNVVASVTPESQRPMVNGKPESFFGQPDSPVKAGWRMIQTALNPKSYRRDALYLDSKDIGDDRVIEKARLGLELSEGTFDATSPTGYSEESLASEAPLATQSLSTSSEMAPLGKAA